MKMFSEVQNNCPLLHVCHVGFFVVNQIYVFHNPDKIFCALNGSYLIYLKDSVTNFLFVLRLCAVLNFFLFHLIH